MNRRMLSPRAGLLVSAASVAVLAAACSSASANSADAGASPSSITAGTSSTAGTSATSSSSPSSVASSISAGSSTYQKSVAYAACMRQHGVPNFPDPMPNGGFGLNSSITGGTNGQFSAQYLAAENACESLLPSGSQSAQQQESELSKLLKVSACMRIHGYKNFPDPTVSNQGVTLHMVGFDRSSPQFESALQTCETQAGTGSTQG